MKNDERCPSFGLGGWIAGGNDQRCELPRGHDGPHLRDVFNWDASAIPEMWWSSAHGAVVHEGWRQAPYQVVTSTGLIDLDALPGDAIRLAPYNPAPPR